MAIEYINDCVCCDLPCINCGRKSVPTLVCDECGEEYDELYEYDGDELCEECLVEAVKDTCRRITLD